MAESPTAVGVRLAIRSDGDRVRFFLADLEGMDSAKELASFDQALFAEDPELFEDMKAAFTRWLGRTVTSATGISDLDMQEWPAPEEERL